MGANVDYDKIEKSNGLDINSYYDDLVKQSKYSNGHGGYTGTFAESPGLTVTNRVFITFADAEDYIMNTAEKWENSLAVTVKREDGSEYWVIGGCFSC